MSDNQIGNDAFDSQGINNSTTRNAQLWFQQVLLKIIVTLKTVKKEYIYIKTFGAKEG